MSVTSTPGNGQSYVTGETLQVTATFNKAVKVVGDPKLRINLDTGRVVIVPANVDDNNVHFEYTIGPADYNQNLLESSATAIRMKEENIIVHSELSDATVLSLIRTWAKVENFSLNGLEAPVNTHRPVIVGDGVNLTSTPVAAAGTYGLGEAIEVTVTFNAPVFVDTTFGTPYVAVDLETADSATYSKVAQALYRSGGGTSTLVFHYIVEAADEDDDGFHIGPDSLFPNSGTIRDRVATDSAATDADLGHLAPGENNGDFPDHKVDGSLVTSMNRAPTFSASSATRSFTETVGDAAVQIAADIGEAITADDDDNDTLTYSLEGVDEAKFEVDSTSGQIRTKVGQQYDHETKPSYSVTVKADDDNGGVDTISVTISVNNTAEEPLTPAAPSLSATSGSRTSLDVSWTAPNNVGRPAIMSYDLQYKKTSESGWTPGPQDLTTTSAEIADLEQNTSYDVQVRATNGDGDSDWSSIGGGRTNANSAPAFADSTTTRSFTETVGDAEVQTAADIGAAVTAEDDDNDTLTYSLVEGADEAKFDIVSTSGQIRTKVGEQYDHEAKSSYSVTVEADDVHGGADTIDVTISIGDEKEAPLTPAVPSVSSTADTTTSLDVNWSEPNNAGRPAITGYDLQYRQGTSGGWTDGPPDLTTTNATIGSLEEDTPYQVQVRATNNDGDSAWSNEGDGRTNAPANNAPTFADDSVTFNFDETVGAETVQSAADIGAAVTATDEDEDDTLDYSLEGADEAKFTIDGSSGQIRTRVGQAYDRETTASYSVIVKADDGRGGTDTIDVTINVDNATESPLAPAAPTVSPTSGAAMSLDVSWDEPPNTGRPAITGYDLQYREGTTGNWLDGPLNVTGATAVIEALERDVQYEVRVLARNDDGDGDWSGAGNGRTNPNTPPRFPDGAVAWSFTETVGDTPVDSAIAIGSPITATDDDDDTLTYRLDGPDAARFGVVLDSGQIQTRAGEIYDHEAASSYLVTLKVDDGNGGADTIEVTIDINNTTEPPRQPSAPIVSALAGRSTSLYVIWKVPNNTGRPPISGYDLQYSQGTTANWIDGPQDLADSSATLKGLEAAADYQVQVRASNPDGDSDWSNPGGARTPADTESPVCSRTPEVRDAITAAASRTACSDVTDAELAGITILDLSGLGVTSLKADDLKGLSGLETLDLSGNELSSLPEGLFADLTNLRVLLLHDNMLSSLPEAALTGLTELETLWLNHNAQVSMTQELKLERRDDGTSSSQATVGVDISAGAPFDLTVDLEAEGGTLSTDSVTIKKGETRGSDVTMTRSGDSPAIVRVAAPPRPPATTCGVNNDPCFQGVVFEARSQLVLSNQLELVLTPNSIAENGGSSRVTATLSPASPLPFTVDISVDPGSTAVVDDFSLSPNTTLSFAANATRSTGEVTITAVDNADPFPPPGSSAPDEKTIVVSGAVTGAEMTAPLSELLTILDDELPAVTVSFASSHHEVTEGSNVQVTAQLDTDPKREVVVALQVRERGGATLDDYAASVPATLTFASGQTTVDFTFEAATDDVPESYEAVAVYLSEDLPLKVTGDGAVILEIRDSGGRDDGDDDGGGDDGRAPEAAITIGLACQADLCRAYTGVPVTFTDTSAGFVRSRSWDFGDGSKSPLRTLDYAWSEPGFYDVILWVSNGAGESVAKRTVLVEARDPAGSCQTDSATRCLQDSRYEVKVEWWTKAGESGTGTVVHAGTNDSGLFYFFNPDNWEILVKVLDGCAVNGHIWVFGASTTDLGYRIAVTDTVNGTVKHYGNEPGMPAPAITDTQAFAGRCSAGSRA